MTANREADNRPALWKARREATHDRLTQERIELVAQYRRRQIRRAKRRETIKQFARATFWVAVAIVGLLAVSISSIRNY